MSSDGSYLFDTSIWIRLQRKTLPDQIRSLMAARVRAGMVATNQIVRVEVLAGSRDAREFDTNSAQLAGLIDLSIIDETWHATAALAYSLRRKGITPSLPDAIIAASAIEHLAVVVHADNHFDQIAEHTGLRVEGHLDAI